MTINPQPDQWQWYWSSGIELYGGLYRDNTHRRSRARGQFELQSSGDIIGRHQRRHLWQIRRLFRLGGKKCIAFS